MPWSYGWPKTWISGLVNDDAVLLNIKLPLVAFLLSIVTEA